MNPTRQRPGKKALLDAGAEVNRRNNGKWDTPLAQAASSGDVAMTRLLLGRGADVNLLTPHGTSALDWAVMDHRREIIDLLIADGAR